MGWSGDQLYNGVDWLAYNSVAHDALSHEAMTLHRNWALPTLGLWAVAASWGFFSRKIKPSLIFILFLWLSTASLLVTGYLGAENVYRHGIGVMRLPASMGEGHGHEEAADGHDHSVSNTDEDHEVNLLKSDHMPIQGKTPAQYEQQEDFEGQHEGGHEPSSGHEH